MLTSHFVISLDFELLWGVRDHADRASYGANILGGREAIPAMLEIFTENAIRATWATVGFLLCENKDEILSSLPEQLPAYRDQRLSNYSYLGEVGNDERSDPYYFGNSLIRKIQEAPGQEIGTHTLSHYYCLEEGATVSSFEADLAAALSVAARRNIKMRSIVFPRNQFAAEHLEVCQRLGLTAYRGNPEGWAYRAAQGAEQTLLRRTCRLADAYTGVLGTHVFHPETGSGNVPASRFLRPSVGQLARFHRYHLETIRRGMTAAAKSGAVFHLWWHPHNFGKAAEENLDGLRKIISHYRTLAGDYGMQSAAMADLA